MKTIFRYKALFYDEIDLLLPKDAEILKVDIDDAIMFNVWAYIDRSEEKKLISRKFKVVGTGQPFEDRHLYKYIDTVFTGKFVWHVFLKTVL
jgi:hypothetical protein